MTNILKPVNSGEPSIAQNQPICMATYKLLSSYTAMRKKKLKQSEAGYLSVLSKLKENEREVIEEHVFNLSVLNTHYADQELALAQSDYVLKWAHVQVKENKLEAHNVLAMLSGEVPREEDECGYAIGFVELYIQSLETKLAILSLIEYGAERSANSTILKTEAYTSLDYISHDKSLASESQFDSQYIEDAEILTDYIRFLEIEIGSYERVNNESI